MQKTFILVTLCLKVKKSGYDLCHFKGVFKGLKVAGIWIKQDKKFKLVERKEYVLHLELEKYQEGYLYCTILKLKLLEDFNF
ncbi:MAG: hypothetical protein KBD63_01900 [Bacteriovoracaceae bacterium]|nr:hypothetical protein [Bacteriovoracaceae bacterium]